MPDAAVVEATKQSVSVEKSSARPTHQTPPSKDYENTMEAAKQRVQKDPIQLLKEYLDKKGRESSVEAPQKKREFSAKDVLRHKVLELEARRLGIKDTVKFNRLVNYFEENIKNIDVTERMNMQRADIPLIKAMVDSGLDLIPVFDALKTNMFLPSSEELRYQSSRTLAPDSKIAKILSCAKVPGSIDLIKGMSQVPHDTVYFQDELAALSNLTQGETAASFTPEFFEKVGLIAKVLGVKVKVSELPAYLELVNNPTKLMFFAQAARTGRITYISIVDQFHPLEDLATLEKDGLLEPLTKLMELGIEIKYDIPYEDPFGIKGVTKGGDILGIIPGKTTQPNQGPQTQEEIDQVLKGYINRPDIKALLNEPDRQKFAQFLRAVSKYDIRLEDFNEYYPIRKDLVKIHNMVFPSIDWDLGVLDKFTELRSLINGDARKALIDPEFEKFLHDLAIQGITLGPDDFFNYTRNMFGNDRNMAHEAVLVQLFRAREILSVFPPEFTREIIEGGRENGDRKISNTNLDKLESVVRRGNTVKLLRKYGVEVGDKLTDTEWLLQVRELPFIRDAVFDNVPEAQKGDWIRLALKMPVDLQNYLLDSFDRMHQKATSENIEKAFKVGKILESSDYFPKDRNEETPELTQVYYLMAHFKGDVEILLTAGKPNLEFAKVALESKDSFALVYLLDRGLLAQFTPEQQIVLKAWRDLPQNLRIEVMKQTNDLLAISPEGVAKFQTALEGVKIIMHSSSVEIKRLKNELVAQLWKAEDPQESLDRILGVFEKNNLPLVGKVFRVFEILHPPAVLDKKVKNGIGIGNNLSPVLKEASTRRRYDIIYKDLLRVHIDSANPSLYSYLVTLRDGQTLVDKVQTQGLESLNAQTEVPQLTRFLNKMDTLLANSLYGRRTGETGSASANLLDRIQELRRSYGLKEGQTLTERVGAMFVKPLGFENIDAVIKHMDAVRGLAHDRNLAFYNEATGNSGKLKISAGDLLKGVKQEYLEAILQNGSVAKDYLGGAADSDSTPFDTDVSRVLPQDLISGYEGIIQNSLVHNYGSIVFLFRNRGQFHEGFPGRTNDRYELFPSGTRGDRHYGIRTGIASTEIDAMIVKDDITKDPANLERVFFDVAQAGFYIPISDVRGSIIFKPDDYERYRLKKAEIQDALSQADFDSANLIGKLKASPYLSRLYESDSGVSEGYSLERHSNMVLGQFEKYFSSAWSSPILTKEQFRLVLSLHDLGKPLAVQATGNRKNQHEYTMKFIPPILEQMGFNPRDAQIASSIIEDDYIGGYIKGEKSAGQTARTIKDKAVEVGISTKDMMELLRTYYICDAGSYTQDAGGIASLDRLFNFGTDENGNRRAQFAPEVQQKFAQLLQQVYI